MKFNALREDLLSNVQKVQYSSDTRGMMPILSGLKIQTTDGNINFSCTDLESFSTAGCQANVSGEGTCVINMKIFMEFLRDSRDEKIEAELQGSEMVLRGQRAEFRLFTMPPEDFPNLPEVNIPVLEGVDGKRFLNSIQKITKAASNDEKRPTLMGVLMEIGEEVNMVSTDSYRLAIGKMKEGFVVKEEGSYIIPSRAIINLARVSEKEETINMYRDDNRGQVRFELSKSNHVIRLIEGKFPKYQQFIPESMENVIEVEKEEIMGAIKRISLLNSTLKMKVEKDRITITSESRDLGEGKEEIQASYKGEEMEIAFNSKFLEDGVSSIEGEKVRIGITEPLKPGILKGGEEEDFQYVIMPIRL
jgi:DNA polymerase-3 subunit beta